MISTPTTAARPRWRSWIAGDPSKARLKPPPHSGQAPQLPLAPLPPTREPLRIRRPAPPADTRGRGVAPREPRFSAARARETAVTALLGRSAGSLHHTRV